MPVKFLKKALRSGKRLVKRRYGIGKKRTLNMGALAKDVARMVSVINAEKKSKELPLEFRYIAQAYVNVSGTQIWDVSPWSTTQGLTASNRTGDSIKLCSALFEFQVAQLSAANVENKFIIELWYNKGQYQTEATALTQLFSPSTFSQVIDFNSPRYQNYYGDYRCFRRKIITMKSDSTSGDTQTQTFNIPIKFNKGKGHHIRYVANTGVPASVQNGQMFMTVRCQNGNYGLTASTLSIPIQAPNTGLQMNSAVKFWFYDN